MCSLFLRLLEINVTILLDWEMLDYSLNLYGCASCPVEDIAVADLESKINDTGSSGID